MRTLTLLMLPLLIIGCAVCGREEDFVRMPPTGESWDATYLIDLDPDAVSTADVTSQVAAAETHYWTYSAVEGCAWQPMRSKTELANPDSYGSGGDTLIFTGFATAGFAWKLAATDDAGDLAAVQRSLRGLYLLTHVGGDGVLARCAWPAEDAARFGRATSGDFIGVRSADDMNPIGGPFPTMYYYTRGTKDQLTGLIFGLSVVWATVTDHDAREFVARITEDVYDQLIKYHWRIRDSKGENDTSADDVDDLLRIAVLALYRQTVVTTTPGRKDQVEADYLAEFEKFKGVLGILEASDRYNNYDQYYAFNLRAARALSIWLLDEDPDRRSDMVDYYEKHVWNFTDCHQNAWLAWVRAAMSPGDEAAIAAANWAFRAQVIKPFRLYASPYHGQEESPGLIATTIDCTCDFVVAPHLREPSQYFAWQEAPWAVGDKGPPDLEGQRSSTGIELFLPYWMARHFSLVRWPGMLR